MVVVELVVAAVVVVVAIAFVERLQHVVQHLGLDFVAPGRFEFGSNCSYSLVIDMDIDQLLHIEVDRMGKIVGRSEHNMA